MSEPKTKFNLKTDWPRLVLLVIALLIANFWIEMHLTMAWWVRSIMYFVSGFLSVLSFLSGFMSEPEENKKKQLWRAIIEWFVQRRQLIAIYVMEALVILFASSVTITANESMEVRIDHAGTVEQQGSARKIKEGTTVFTKFIVPWGRSYSVAAGGYQTQEVTVYPWFSAECQLKEEPVVFVGLVGIGSGMFHDLTFTILINGDEAKVLAQGKTSLLIGGKKDLTIDWSRIKTMFLAKYPDTEGLFPQIESEWSSPLHFNPRLSLKPGDNIVVTVAHAVPPASAKVALTLDENDENFYITFASRQ